MWAKFYVLLPESVLKGRTQFSFPLKGRTQFSFPLSCSLGFRCNVEKLRSHSYTMNWTIIVLWLLNHVHLFATPWTAAHQASLSFTTSQSMLRLVSIKSVMPSNHPILCRPLLLLPSIPPCIIVFSSSLHQWPKYWSFGISPSSEQSGFISFRIDWFHLLAVQGTLKSLLQRHSSKASVLQCSPFFMVSAHFRTWIALWQRVM